MREDLKEFLTNRTIFWFNDNGSISIVTDTNLTHIQEFHNRGNITWLNRTRGYINKKDNIIMVFQNDYELPNIMPNQIMQLFEKFNYQYKTIGLGCKITKEGETWEPKLTLTINR